MNNVSKEFASMREMMQDMGRRIDNFMNGRIDNTNSDVTDAQVALADSYEEAYTAITEVQEALVEIYEMIEGGK